MLVMYRIGILLSLTNETVTRTDLYVIMGVWAFAPCPTPVIPTISSLVFYTIMCDDAGGAMLRTKRRRNMAAASVR